MSDNTKKNFEVKPYTKEEREKILQDIDNKLLEFINSDKYKEVLLMMGNLGNYSLTNQIYILLQNENATSVAGMKEWNYKGRSIIPGEKAIKIFAPIKGKDEVLLVDEDGNPLLDEEGKQRTREVERIKGFKPAFVFDITQTTGKELQAFKFDENSTVTFEGSGTTDGMLITHKVIVAPTLEDGKLMLQTQGIANEIPDDPIDADRIVSIMVCKIPLLRGFYSFFFSPWGLLTIIGLVIFIFIDELMAFIRTLTGNKSPKEAKNIDEIIDALITADTAEKLKANE